MKPLQFFLFLSLILMIGCNNESKKKTAVKNQNMFTGAKNEVKIITLDPGHFHASLLQKSMYKQVDSMVYVFAPEGPDVQNYLNTVNGFNNRAENPTHWVEKVYTGDDYFDKMLAEKPGNVMVTAGNNAKKTEYILHSVEAGINVLADKPMVITSDKFSMLEKAFEVAKQNNVLLYDIMTERHEITTILQRELSKIPKVFGQLQTGTAENPAITKESVHHFFKYVAGNPIKRPAWFFDVSQQGEGIVDITTHLVDLIQWEAFPEVVLNKEDVQIISAKHWPTILTSEMFNRVTHLDSFPAFLQKDIENDLLKTYCNGEINYTLKGVHAKVSVIWNYEAPEGTGDTHYSIMRGSKCNLIIQQGEKEEYKPTIYIQANQEIDPEEFEIGLSKAVDMELAKAYPGISLVKIKSNLWTIDIPQKYKVGHEAHFAQVTEKYLQYLIDGKLPEWEVPNMIVKYYTTTEGMKAAMQ